MYFRCPSVLSHEPEGILTPGVSSPEWGFVDEIDTPVLSRNNSIADSVHSGSSNSSLFTDRQSCNYRTPSSARYFDVLYSNTVNRISERRRLERVSVK